MSDALKLGAAERLLIFAPHPDDESIATGGLIQAAFATGASVRVVVMTDGDNNPWPQRWIEKRWRIDAAARARWGARRREEAREAMRVLGLADTDAEFLGLADLGLTDLLMCDDRRVLESLRGAIAEFRPTLLALPALSDRHPDHSAAHILVRLACQEWSPRLLTFAVHGGKPVHDTVVALSAAQRETKRLAIRAHATQMRLSERRFLRYAEAQECFMRIEADRPNPDHPLQATVDADGRLQIDIDRRRWRESLHGHCLFVASVDGQRLMVPLNPRHADLDIYDAIRKQRVGKAAFRRGSSKALVTLESRTAPAGYVKLALPRSGWRVFDRIGWQAIGETERDSRSR